MLHSVHRRHRSLWPSLKAVRRFGRKPSDAKQAMHAEGGEAHASLALAFLEGQSKRRNSASIACIAIDATKAMPSQHIKLYASPLWRATPIVWNRRDVSYGSNL
jgi:hypothetical protein